jgi:ParB/RepB/Spo0J family partition protein
MQSKGADVETLLKIFDPNYVETKQVEEGKTIQSINVTDILTDLKYPMKSDTSLDRLIDAMKTYGLLEPILVQKDEDGKIHLLDGYRRLRAAKILGMEKITAVALRPDYKLTSHMVHLIKNSFRRSLSLLDEAEVLQELMENQYCSLRELRLMTGKSDKDLKELLTINGLPDIVKEQYREVCSHISIPLFTLARIARMEGDDDEKHWELMKFIKKSRRPPKEIIKERAEVLTKNLERIKISNTQEEDIEEIKGGLKPLKSSIDQLGVNISKDEASKTELPPNLPPELPPYFHRMFPKAKRVLNSRMGSKRRS